MNNLNNYYINNPNLKIEILKKIEKIETNEFLNTYKISNLLKGKFFIKRLINRIFKYNLQSPMSWNKLFWGGIDILVIDISISHGNKFNNLNDFKNHVTKRLSKKSKIDRLKDIYKYKKLISENHELSHPLYITGECLNNLGGNVDSNELFLLDGTRRIVANVLLGKKNIKIYIISKK